jgi:hypothetical protein
MYWYTLVGFDLTTNKLYSLQAETIPPDSIAMPRQFEFFFDIAIIHQCE